MLPRGKAVVRMGNVRKVKELGFGADDCMATPFRHGEALP
jgi:hypothetical protein